jgi:hypothetical protein
MNPQDVLLAQLRDIHAAPAVPWWPPAPGWWVLAVLLLAALAVLIRRLQQRRRAQQRRQRLLHFIEWIEQTVDPASAPGQYLSDLNRVFKLVALRAFPGTDCVRLTGRDWVDFLRGKLGDTPEQTLMALAEGPYQPAPGFDPQALGQLARRWVSQYG